MKEGDRVVFCKFSLPVADALDPMGKAFKIEVGDKGTLLRKHRAWGNECWLVEFDRHPKQELQCGEEYLELEAAKAVAAPSNGVCVCKIDQLVFGGCICGAMAREKSK